MPFGHARAEPREALRVLEEVDDLLELGGCLVDAGDVLPGDRRTSESGSTSVGLTRGMSASERQTR